MTGFLTEEELYTLTKRKRSSAIIRVLKVQGIAFKLDGNGHPVVTWESVNAHSGVIRKKRQPNIGVFTFRSMRNGASPKDRAQGVPAAGDALPRGVPLPSKVR